MLKDWKKWVLIGTALALAVGIFIWYKNKTAKKPGTIQGEEEAVAQRTD